MNTWELLTRAVRHRGPVFIETVPHQIEAEWDSTLAPRLAGFPVNLLYVSVRKHLFRKRIASCCYLFDPASYIEDSDKREMTYFPRMKSRSRVKVEYHKNKGSWETLKYKGDKLVALALGPEFDGAMMQTTVIGLQPDEPID